MAIYTKKGDRGKTSLYSQDKLKEKRISKASLITEAIGAIDEISSFLGIALAFSKSRNTNLQLKEIQRNLFIINSILAGSKLQLPKGSLENLEKIIDKLEGKLPRLKNFIFPGGSQLSAILQYCRALTRRGERRVVALSVKKKVNPQILSYLNRLSDYLFMISRNENFAKKIKEEIWKEKVS